MSKQEQLNHLVVLGTEWDKNLIPFPSVRYNTKADLEKRCRWLEKAIELKPVDRDLAEALFRAAWLTNYLPSTIAQQAGLA